MMHMKLARTTTSHHSWWWSRLTIFIFNTLLSLGVGNCEEIQRGDRWVRWWYKTLCVGLCVFAYIRMVLFVFFAIIKHWFAVRIPSQGCHLCVYLNLFCHIAEKHFWVVYFNKKCSKYTVGILVSFRIFIFYTEKKNGTVKNILYLIKRFLLSNEDYCIWM